MAGFAESALSTLTLHDADVSSAEELLPSSEEPISASAGTSPVTTIDGSLSSFPYNEEEELIAAGAAESASPQTLQEPDVSSSEELLDATLSEELSTASPSSVLHDTADDCPTSASSVGPPILFRDPKNWYQEFFMRTDRQGYLHMYPDLGGPFESLQEAEAAISHHLNAHRLPEICQKPSEGPLMEWLIKQCLYYPDGTPKRGHNSPARKIFL